MSQPASSHSTKRRTRLRQRILVYLALCVLRVANALLLRTQFDPDEYWQTLEPAYCEAFPDYPCVYTWEWTRRGDPHLDGFLTRAMHGPIRSYLSVLPTFWFYYIVRRLRWDAIDGIISKGPMILHAVLVAAPTDWSIWYMGTSVSDKSDNPKPDRPISWIPTTTTTTFPMWCLICSLTSWFQGYALIRTYSNSLEAMLLAVGMALVAPELFGDETHAAPFARARLAFLLGGLSVAVRFTSLAAWIPLGMALAIQTQPSTWMRWHYLVTTCGVFGVLGIGISLVVDRIFYGFWTLPFLASLHFNVVLGHGSLYGTHPFHWYFTSGIPAISGLLLPFLLVDLWRLLFRSNSVSRTYLWIIIASYTMLHSFSAHKEFRFLLPILPLVCIRAAHVIDSAISSQDWRDQRWAKIRMSTLLLVPNGIALLYLGTFHQRAPLDVNRALRQALYKSSMKGTTTSVTIHYLMGCHSTPLYSHLHTPGIHDLMVWTLDCSPSCRARSSRHNGHECESERFANDPVRFVEDRYIQFQSNTALDTRTCAIESSDDVACIEHNRESPDWLAVFAGDAEKLSLHIASMGLEEIDRFVHGLNGVKVGPLEIGRECFENVAYRHVRWLDQMSWLPTIDVCLDEIVLFAKGQSL